MKKTTRIALLLFELLIIILSVIWWFNDKSYEPVIVLIGSVIALVRTIWSLKKKEVQKVPSPKTIKFKQKAGKESKQYMSYGDMKIEKGNND